MATLRKNKQIDNPGTEEHYQELLALSRVSAALSDLWDLDAILKVALDNVLAIMEGSIGGILVLDENTNTFTYRVYQGLSERFIQEVSLEWGEGIAGSVAKNGKAILLEDISEDPRAAYPDIIGAEGLKAFISVPLRVRDKILGVINIASHTPRTFAKKDMYLLNSVGDLLSVAIEQGKLNERLRKATGRYRQLARQTLVAQDEERKRIARELHDETSQALSGIALHLQALIDKAEILGKQDTELLSGLKKVQSMMVQVNTETNRLIADLRPALLDTLGLISAVRQYAENRLYPLDICVSVIIRGIEISLHKDIEAVLFRFIQGAIGNIAQHSKAKSVSLILEYLDDALRLHIEDDGCGFDVSKITIIENSGRGRGVFGMKERIALLGGTCSIESKPGQGTKVKAEIPLGQGDEHAENTSTGS